MPIRSNHSGFVPSWMARVRRRASGIASWTRCEASTALRWPVAMPPARRCPRQYPALPRPLLLLYATGLRIGEALGLDLADVDLDARLLRVRNSKFYKTRLVPIGADLTRVLADYASERKKHLSTKPDAPFLLTRRGKRLSRAGTEEAFKRLRKCAQVHRADGARYQPRLHDFRHAFAVTRLVRWYRAGANVQRLLPQLATYLGHVHIAGTQRYLTMTPELLRQASLRFERYAFGGDDHA